VTRDAAVDLALLGKGFHVVTGPVPTDTDGPVQAQWNAVYKLLTDAGLSKTPVVEGAGGAAGEAYAWAIENPDRESCVYAENPILRSRMTKAQPLDRLDVLAKVGVPVLHACGSRQAGKAGAGGIWVWGYDEITWFAHQPKEYRAKWLRYAWDWVRTTDPNGYLQMPGSRTVRSPLDGRRWYFANRPSRAVPDGLGDEEAIRAIWADDAGRR